MQPFDWLLCQVYVPAKVCCWLPASTIGAPCNNCDPSKEHPVSCAGRLSLPPAPPPTERWWNPMGLLRRLRPSPDSNAAALQP